MKKLLAQTKIPLWLFLLLFVVLILRIPSFFEPYSYGDEMIYLTLGQGVRNGLTLYKDIHDNKPPLLYLTAALAGNLFWFKAILAIWHLISVVIFWKLTTVLLPKRERLQQIATGVFAIFTTIPLLEGNIANAELFMVGFTCAGFLLLLSKELTVKKIIYAGVLLGTAVLFKMPAAFDIPAIVFLWLAAGKLNKPHLKEVARKTLYLSIGVLLPILLTFIWYAIRGAFGDYVTAAFMQNVGYLSSWRPDDVKEPFFVRNAPLLIRSMLVLTVALILFIKRKVLSKNFIFATIWLVLSLFAVTLSERPYPHYLIQSVPPISILVGILLTKKTTEQVYAIIPLTLAFLVPVYFKFWHYPTYPYYERFIRLSTRQITKDEYLLSFGGDVVTNYKVAKYIASSTKKSDKIFVWGDTAKIYALTKRQTPVKYVADYHIKDFANEQGVINELKANPPIMIVITKDASQFLSLNRFMKDNYALVETIDGTEIWRLLTVGIRAN